jgi:hypothetical protein
MTRSGYALEGTFMLEAADNASIRTATSEVLESVAS